MFQKLLFITSFIVYFHTASFCQDKQREINKIIKLNLAQVKFGHLMDSSNTYYIYFILFSIDSITQNPIVHKTYQYPNESYDEMNRKLNEFKKLQVDWKLLIPDLKKNDEILLPVFYVRHKDHKQIKPLFTFNEVFDIILKAFPKIEIGDHLKVLESIYNYELGFGR